MATPEEIQEFLNEWVKKRDDPKIAEEFEGFNKTMQMVFPDIDYKLKFVFKEKILKLEEGFDKNTEMSIEVNSNVWYGVLTKVIDPIEAFMRGDLKADGDMASLQKLEVLTSMD